MNHRYITSRPLYAGRRATADDGFTCRRCRYYVSANSILSGVVNRNHCPYCLWSRHLDLFTAGDRLAACKQLMQPVGLALKQPRKRYSPHHGGELMLIHQCTDCGKIAINRIAADDDADTVLAVFGHSAGLSGELRARIGQQGIHLLGVGDAPIVKTRLFGESQLTGVYN